MSLRFCSATDVGRRRTVNQDTLVVDPALQLFVIADGMGGHESGDVASRIVAEGIRQFVVDTEFDPDKTWPFDVDVELSYAANRLKAAVLVANHRLSEHVASLGAGRKMGATVAAAQLAEGRAVIASVGDCRAYLMRDGELRQLTRDHSWVAEQVEAGFISAQSARAHPWRHMVTRAVQGQSDLLVDILDLALGHAGRMLLCSDGLHVVLTDQQIAALLDGPCDDPNHLCRSLVTAANEGGGPDNVSAIVIEWSPDGGPGAVDDRSQSSVIFASPHDA